MSRLLPDNSRGNRVVLGVDRQSIAWAHRDAAGLGHMASRSWLADPAAAVRAVLAECGEIIRHAPVDAIVAGDVARHWLQTPPSKLVSFEELRLVARARCALLYGQTSADWLVVGDWQATRSFVCAALPVALMESLQQAFQAQGVTVRWHTAFSLLCATQSHTFPADGWSAIRSPTKVMLWHCSHGYVDGLAELAVGIDESRESVVTRALLQMRIDASRMENLVPSLLHWFDLTDAENRSVPRGVKLVGLSILPRLVRNGLSESAFALLLRPLMRKGAA